MNDEINEATYFSDKGQVLCQVCRKPYGVIGSTHLKKHDMTMEQYKEKFPDAPLSSKSFKVRAKMRDLKGFGSSDEGITDERPNPLMEDLDAPISAKVIREKAKALEAKKPEPEPEPDKLPPILQSKVDIMKFLKTLYPVIRENYSIEKKNTDNWLVYCFITDIVDLQTKTIFDFPNAYWHNRDGRQDYNKENKLMEDGWTIHTFNSPNPTIDMLKDKLDLVF